jgi:hypothetical protein
MTVREEIKDLLRVEIHPGAAPEHVIDEIFNRGLISEVRARNLLINQMYLQRLRYSKSGREAMLDCAACYEVSLETVKRAIYTRE